MVQLLLCSWELCALHLIIHRVGESRGWNLTYTRGLSWKLIRAHQSDPSNTYLGYQVVFQKQTMSDKHSSVLFPGHISMTARDNEEEGCLSFVEVGIREDI
jgi:hypothetical protein